MDTNGRRTVDSVPITDKCSDGGKAYPRETLVVYRLNRDLGIVCYTLYRVPFVSLSSTCQFTSYLPTWNLLTIYIPTYYDLPTHYNLPTVTTYLSTYLL